MTDTPAAERLTDADADLLTWDDVRDRLAVAPAAWLATVPAAGRPHVRPVLLVVADGRLPLLADGRGQGRPVLYVAWEETGAVDATVEGPWEDAVLLRPGLLLLDSAATRSVVYHALKHHLPEDTSLLVAPLADAPKMKGMSPGATTWLRHRGRT